MSVGQKVYQIGHDSNKNLQLVKLEVIEILEDKIRCLIGQNQPLLYPNQVYSDPVGLINVWINQNLKWLHNSISHNIYTLCKIKESLVQPLDQETANLMSKFAPVSNNENI